ncbi:MAG: transporter associated domain-containing protein [Collinsella sp.]
MTPHTDAICRTIWKTPLEENWDVVRQYKYTRYPVCDGSKDRIVGFVHTKDLVDEPKDAPMSGWKIREAAAGARARAHREAFAGHAGGSHRDVCVVVDDTAARRGIVHHERHPGGQIVGRIDDEYVHDTDDDIEELPDGTYQINGTLAIDDLVELLGFEPEAANDVETATACFFMLSLFDRIPKGGRRGGASENRGAKVTFTVLAMDRLRIDRICMAIDRPEEE